MCYRNTSRQLTDEELSLARKCALQEVQQRLGADYLHNLEEVVGEVVTYAVVNYAEDLGGRLNYWDRKVKVVTEIVREWLHSGKYRGPVNFGFLDRTSRLAELAR